MTWTDRAAPLNAERHQADSRRRAEQLVAQLVEAIPAVEGALLFGSLARGDADAWSDIDLLIVGSDQNLTASSLLSVLPEEDRYDHLSLMYYTTDDLKGAYEEGASFIAHVRGESKILYDKSGFLTALFARPFVPTSDVEREIALQLERLVPYSDPARFRDNFLFCLAHLYAIGKSVVMLKLSAAGIAEFNRVRAFAKFGEFFPGVENELETVERLRPFYALVNGKRPEPLPFSYRNADDAMVKGVRAIRAIAAAEK